MHDFETKKALAGMPTCNICGLVSGYTGKGVKNILPSVAMAKLDFHLVPDMDPDKQFRRLVDHLRNTNLGVDREDDDMRRNNVSSIMLETKLIDKEPPAKTPIHHPFVK